MATTYLTNTLSGSPTDGNKWTWSAWIKRSKLGTGQPLFYADDGSANYATFIRFRDTDQLDFSNQWAGSNDSVLLTDRKFRDTNSWYHIQAVLDTSNATAADRQILYVNGVRETDFATETTATLNRGSTINDAYQHRIGRGNNSFGSDYFDGYMSHVHFSDGNAYAPTVFGETDSGTGQWKLKTSPSITMGTNGFTILKDGNTITDQSSNSNDWALGGGTLIQTEDCPDNVFATLNALQTNLTLVNGNNSATTTNYKYGVSTIGVNSGKYYFELKVTHGCMIIGIQDMVKANEKLNVNNTFWFSGSESYHLDGFSRVSHDTYGDIANDASAYPTYGSGDIIMMALDLDNNKLAYGKNGTWYNSTNPSSGTTNMISIDAPSTTSSGFYGIVCADTCGASDGTFDVNFGNGFFGTTAISSEGSNASGIGKFEYDVPTGYTALSTKGLNE